MVQNGNQDLIYVRGELADTITFNADGSATHAFANGQTVHTKAPSTSSGANRHRMILANCQALADLVNSDRMQLAWDTGAVILAFGAGAAAAFFSGGALGVAAGIADTFVGAAWINADNALGNARNSYASAGC